MLEISYAFVAEDHRAQVRVRLEDPQPAAEGKKAEVPLWTWAASFSSKQGTGGAAQHDPAKTKSAGHASHQQALTAGIDALRTLYAEAALDGDELEQLLAQV